MHLRDYHRQNLLNGDGKVDQAPVKSYAEEQSDLKNDLLNQMHNSSGDENQANDDGSDDNGFMVRKSKPEKKKLERKQVQLDVEGANKDPESYLDNFMTSRAWVPQESSKYQPFESDDSDDDRAEDFEQAYNLRFEDPAHANEQLVSHSRHATEKYSVRREDPKGRKRARQDERSKKDAERAQREEDKARLRRLKIDEAHEKWMSMKEAAGLKKQNLSDEKLMEFLERGFEGGNWDKEMEKFLGEAYYDEKEEDNVDLTQDLDRKKDNKRRKALAKPTWEDDIDIGDIVPDFNEEEEKQRQNITLSDEDEGHDDRASADLPPTQPTQNGGGQVGEKTKSANKRQNRIARQKISELVDNEVSNNDLPMSKHTGFRYRDTSPSAFGLSARDILMANDTQLNEYVGLKKLASYRDETRKEKDKKKLGKKARLRKWKRETFGKDPDDIEASEANRVKEDKDFEDWFNRGRGLDSKPHIPHQSKKRKSRDVEPDDREAGSLGDSKSPKKKKKKRSHKSKVQGS